MYIGVYKWLVELELTIISD